MTGLPVQAGGGDVAGPVMATGGEQDEVTWEGLVLPHHHDVADLTERDRRVTQPVMAHTSIMDETLF